MNLFAPMRPPMQTANVRCRCGAGGSFSALTHSGLQLLVEQFYAAHAVCRAPITKEQS